MDPASFYPQFNDLPGKLVRMGSKGIGSLKIENWIRKCYLELLSMLHKIKPIYLKWKDVLPAKSPSSFFLLKTLLKIQP